MMLSPRRFWCVVCLGAIAVGGMVFEPVQQFVKRSAIEYTFGGNVSAGNIQWHRHQELLEVNELKTIQIDDAVQVVATADVALVKLDMPTLVDKRFVGSRVKLQNVQIELTSLPIQKPIAKTANSWQQSLDEVLVGFQWENLRSDCEALLKSDSVLDELDNKMRGWLLRSQQIMFHGDQLTRAIQTHSNPLRQQNEIRTQIAQLGQLRLEQENLQKQFSSVNSILEAQLKDIHSLGDQEIATIRTRCEAKAASLKTLTAEQTVCEWANQLITPQLQLSQSCATLLQSDARPNPYDINVRKQSAGSPLLSLSGIVADGFILDATKRIPFSAKGEYSTVERVGYQLGRTTDWEVQLDTDTVTTQLHIASGDLDGVWNLKSTSEELKADAVDSAMMFKLEGLLSGRELSGTARMNLGMYHAFTKLSCKANADLAVAESLSNMKSANAALNDDWIEFSLSGTAFVPQVSLVSTLPAEFTNTITESIQKRLETQRIDSESKLKNAIGAKTEELSKQLAVLVKDGQQTLSQQRDALTAMHRQLEQSLQSNEGFEYARVPSKTNTNH